jgi:hypothetical protein
MVCVVLELTMAGAVSRYAVIVGLVSVGVVSVGEVENTRLVLVVPVAPAAV